MQIERKENFSNNWNRCELITTYDGIAVTDDTWVRKTTLKPFSILMIMTGGSGRLTSGNGEQKLEPGYVYLAPCGMPVGYHGLGPTEQFGFNINVILPDGYDLFSSCKRILRLPYPAEDTEKLIEMYRSDEAARQIVLKGTIWSVVAAFAQMLTPEEDRVIRYSETVKTAISYIRDHLSASLTVQEVCDAVYTSKAYLNRRFQQEMHISVFKYIEELLMFKAQRLLLTTDKTIGQISTKLRFCDQFYFSRWFKRLHSVSPYEFRKTRKEN